MARTLFISRAYPPIIGGIENQNYELSHWLPRYGDVRTIASPYGKKALPFFIPFLLAYILLNTRKYDTVLLGDGVLGIVAWWTKKLLPKKRVVAIIHGLDVTYASAFYQALWVQRFLPQCDSFIAVGNQTKEICIQKGLPKDKIHFIPNGIDPEKFLTTRSTREDLISLIGEQHRDKKIILTTGRLATRKGAAWFIDHILPRLSKDIIYVVAGRGPDRENILKAIEQTDSSDRTVFLDGFSDHEREVLLHNCDLFVQPNIEVSGDMEGFGISVIEAAASGIPVIASHLEGLKDAIIHNKNGMSIPSGNPSAWIQTVEEVLAQDFDRSTFGKKSSSYVVENFSWDHIAQQYIKQLG